MPVICCSSAWNRTRRTLLLNTRARVDAIRNIQIGRRPAWSAGDAASIAMFFVRPGVEALTTSVDNDESGIARHRAIESSGRWTKAGRKVLCVIPRRFGDDLNDVICKMVVT
jgi:hypothetical protein